MTTLTANSKYPRCILALSANTMYLRVFATFKVIQGQNGNKDNATLTVFLHF